MGLPGEGMVEGGLLAKGHSYRYLDGRWAGSIVIQSHGLPGQRGVREDRRFVRVPRHRLQKGLRLQKAVDALFG